MSSTGAFDPLTLVAPAFSAIVGFLLGLVAFSANELRRTRRERRALASLFAQHIDMAWEDIDQLKTAPVGEYYARVTLVRYGVDNLNLTGEHEYEFEVDNLSLFATEGMKLASLIRGDTRRQLWRCYDLLRKAESVRVLIKELPSDDRHKAEYQEFFKKLVAEYATALTGLNKLLRRSLAGRILYWRAPT